RGHCDSSAPRTARPASRSRRRRGVDGVAPAAYTRRQWRARPSSRFALWSCARTLASRRFAQTARPISTRGGGEMSSELRCRVCERTPPLAPIAACPECAGPLDVVYGLESGAPRRERRSMWRYEGLLPHAPADWASPGLTPLVPAPRLSHALGVDLLLKLES